MGRKIRWQGNKIGNRSETNCKGVMKIMTAMAMKLNSIIGNLDDRIVAEIIRYTEYLVYAEKQGKVAKNVNKMEAINAMFTDDKTWDSETSMVKELAEFRRSHVL